MAGSLPDPPVPQPRGEGTPIYQSDQSCVSEINRTFELSPSWCVKALDYIKANPGIQSDPGVIANSTIDGAINALL